MYCSMSLALIPNNGQGKLSVKNPCSILTASMMIFWMTCLLGRLRRWLKRRQAKSVWRPSSREMSSLEKVKPGMRPRFLSQKMDANDPEKKIPSTAAKATRRSANVEFLSAIQRRAHSAFALIQGTRRQYEMCKTGKYWFRWHRRGKCVGQFL